MLVRFVAVRALCNLEAIRSLVILISFHVLHAEANINKNIKKRRSGCNFWAVRIRGIANDSFEAVSKKVQGRFRIQQSMILKRIGTATFSKRKSVLIQQIRDRLLNFKLKIHIGWATNRAMLRLKALKGKVPPAMYVV